ncbi:MAG: hypothetical protein WBV79_03210 [Rhodomicrobium sp.]
MHSDKTAMALYDIRDKALYARQFVEGITFEAARRLPAAARRGPR